MVALVLLLSDQGSLSFHLDFKCNACRTSPILNILSSGGKNAATDQVLHPGVVPWWDDSHLDDGGRDEDNQTEWGDVLPHVEVEGIRSESKHVLQVLHEPDSQRATGTGHKSPEGVH